ncbi:hypothetical protein LguiA_020981 [Lonicera macranthoides]
MPKMGRLEKLLQLLLLGFLLLVTFQQHYAEVQAKQSVDFKLRPAKRTSRKANGFNLTTWVKDKKIYKKPSGPNPTGNHRPPSRP